MICRNIWFLPLAGCLLGGCSKCPTLTETGGNRVVLTEIFSYSGCAYCPNAEEAIHDLASEYGDSLAVLIYHMRLNGDTLSPQDAQARADWYEVGNRAPIAFFDGMEKWIGAQSVESAYNGYRDKIAIRRAVWSPLEMKMEAWLTATAIRIDRAGMPPSSTFGDLKLRLVLFQDSVLFNSSVYDFVVRVVEEMDISLLSLDTSYATIAFPNQWENGTLGAVAFVQDDATREVLQAVVKNRFRHDFRLACFSDTFQAVPVDTEAVFRLFLENAGSLNDVYELSLTVVDSVQGWSEGYCYRGLCYPPFVVGRDTLSAGAVDSTISVTITPVDHPGLEVVCFRARSLGDTTLVDSVYLYTQADGGLCLTESRRESRSVRVLDSTIGEAKKKVEFLYFE